MDSPLPAAERQITDRGQFARAIADCPEPFVMRGLVRDWPLCRAARESAEALSRYLGKFDNGTPVALMLGTAAIRGRLFYDEEFRRLNFSTRSAPFAEVLRAIIATSDVRDAPTIYMGSAPEPRHWPGLSLANPMPLLDSAVQPNLWMGGRAVVGAHNDFPDNIACVVAGRRRFQLFPPDQFANLYVGPMELNPAGRPVSFVSATDPDLERFPRFATALAASRFAELEAGDAIFIPSMWWHSVESLAPLNLLVNYWWETSPGADRLAEAALVHTLLAMAPLSTSQRCAWRAVFDSLAFHGEGDPVAHIPPDVRGWLGQLTPDLRDKMRGFIRRSLLD